MQQDPLQNINTTDLTKVTNLNSLGIDPKLINSAVDTGIKISIALTVIFVIYMIINIARRWKSEKAMVEMAKDIKAIKILLEKQVVDKSLDANNAENKNPTSTVG